MWEKHTTKEPDILFGKKVAVVGSSSIDPEHDGISFMERIYLKYGLIIVNNAKTGSFLTATTENYASDPINQLKKIDDMSTSVDLVICQPGLNDDTQNRPLGTWDGTSYTEFYYCLHQMCLKLYQKFPSKPKGVMTGQYFGVQSARESEYQKAIKEVCAYYSIPVLDLKAEGQAPYNISTWKSSHTMDNLHLNNAGHDIVARRVEAFIRQLLTGV